jgi:hypothetical protein
MTLTAAVTLTLGIIGLLYVVSIDRPCTNNSTRAIGTVLIIAGCQR